MGQLFREGSLTLGQLLTHLPTLDPASLRDSETQLHQWRPKILVLLSSPSRQRENWAAGTEQVLVGAQFQELDFSILERQVMEQRNQRSKSRLTLQTARRLQAQKLQKEANKKAKQEVRTAKSATIPAHKELRQAGMQARKQERLRKKRVAALRKAGRPFPPEDQEPIPDPEVQAQAIAQVQAENATENKSRSGSGSGSDESDESSVEFHL